MILGYELACISYVALGPPSSLGDWFWRILVINVFAAMTFFFSIEVFAPPFARRRRMPWVVVALLTLIVVAGWKGGTQGAVKFIAVAVALPTLLAWVHCHQYATESEVRRFLQPPPPGKEYLKSVMEELAQWKWLESQLVQRHADESPWNDRDRQELLDIRAGIHFCEQLLGWDGGAA